MQQHLPLSQSTKIKLIIKLNSQPTHFNFNSSKKKKSLLILIFPYQIKKVYYFIYLFMLFNLFVYVLFISFNKNNLVLEIF